MKPDARRTPNVALIAAVLFSAFCWLCLYAAFENFAQAGFDLMTRPGLVHSAAGAGLVALHALGLLLVFVLAGGAVAAVVRTPRHAIGHRHANGAPH
jgi:hypothetical protein